LKTIHRSNPDRHFTILPNDLLQSDLSGRALGLLVKILSLPDNWKIQKQWLRGKDGREAIESAFDELESAGYMRRLKPTETQAGRFAPLAYQFTDTPGKFPTVDGFPYTVCRTRLTVDGNPTATKDTSPITRKKGLKTKEPWGAFQPVRDFPRDEDEMLDTIETETGQRLTGILDTIARRFFDEMNGNNWQAGGHPVIDWLKVLDGRIYRTTGSTIIRTQLNDEDIAF
jgi:hypothetical protein